MGNTQKGRCELSACPILWMVYIFKLYYNTNATWRTFGGSVSSAFELAVTTNQVLSRPYTCPLLRLSCTTAKMFSLLFLYLDVIERAT